MEKCGFCDNEINKEKDISIVTNNHWYHIDCWFGELCNHLKKGLVIE